MAIGELLALGRQLLKGQVDLPVLEAACLLAYVLQKDHAFLLAHPEVVCDDAQEQQFRTLLKRRLTGEPIAYLLGQKSFWTVDLIVTPDVLIPRPETELLVETALSILPNKHVRVADLGTGSGAIACALACERNDLTICATDKSENALAVAKKNASSLGLSNITFYLGNWCAALPNMLFHLIISNPPYIDQADVHLSQGDVRFEPASALVAAERGFADFGAILSGARQCLVPGGYLLLEHGYEQQNLLIQRLSAAGYEVEDALTDFSGHPRAVLAKLPP